MSISIFTAAISEFHERFKTLFFVDNLAQFRVVFIHSTVAFISVICLRRFTGKLSFEKCVTHLSFVVRHLSVYSESDPSLVPCQYEGCSSKVRLCSGWPIISTSFVGFR